MCGGRHPAAECHDRRRIFSGDVPPVITAPEEAPAGAIRPGATRAKSRAAPLTRRWRSWSRRLRPGRSPRSRRCPAGIPWSRVCRQQRSGADSQSGWFLGLALRLRHPRGPRPRAASSVSRAPPSESTRKEQPRGTKRPPWQDDEEHFDRLARVAHAEEGPRRALRTPTEIFRSRAGSRLFLGALPTAQNKALFPEIAFQITAMAQSPSISGYRIASQLVGSQLQRSVAGSSRPRKEGQASNRSEHEHNVFFNLSPSTGWRSDRPVWDLCRSQSVMLQHIPAFEVLDCCTRLSASPRPHTALPPCLPGCLAAWCLL